VGKEEVLLVTISSRRRKAGVRHEFEKRRVARWLRRVLGRRHDVGLLRRDVWSVPEELEELGPLLREIKRGSEQGGLSTEGMLRGRM